MASLTVRQVGLAASAPAPVAATAGGGDVFAPGDHTMLRVINGGGAPITVTVDSASPCSYGFDHDTAYTVAAGATREVGPFPGARYASLADGLVHVTYSAVTSVTVEAISV